LLDNDNAVGTSDKTRSCTTHLARLASDLAITKRHRVFFFYIRQERGYSSIKYCNWDTPEPDQYSPRHVTALSRCFAEKLLFTKALERHEQFYCFARKLASRSCKHDCN